MALNAKKREEAKAAAGGNDKPKEDDFDPKADLSKMSLQEQLAWNKKRMAAKQAEKEAAAKLVKPEAPKE